MLRRLFFLIIFGVFVFWAANYKMNGRPLYKIVKGFLTSEGYKESTRDMKLFFGGFLKTMGEQIQEDVTEADKKQLEIVIKNQMGKGEK